MDSEPVIVTARHLPDAQRLASDLSCEAGTDWEEAVSRKDIDAVIVCTPPDSHAAISIRAMESGKHVLCEKPLSRTVQEAEAMLRAAEVAKRTLKCGFNHRHHPAVLAGRQLLVDGTVGEPVFARALYGIGGRPGYEREWRADPSVVSGGQLMEQGIHAIDILRWFLGEFETVTGLVSTAFWPIRPLEDNAFAILRTDRGAIASVHASLTQWTNLFSIEVFGREGHFAIEGLGGSYGVERLTLSKREFGRPFSAHSTEYRGEDRSWDAEWSEFSAAITEGREPIGNGVDGLQALLLVNRIYDAASSGMSNRRRETELC
jgi:predicted dehydrogenase